MDRIRLIASDMDATLLDEYSQLPPKFTETIRALAGQGILFAAASGRPLYTLETMFPDLLEEIILIGDNGGAARWKGKDLFVSEMPAAGPQHKAGRRRGPFVRPAGCLCRKAG
jgi:hydroxymethylpyrimidine pyrophosphatase-like HAD family hydrolase